MQLGEIEIHASGKRTLVCDRVACLMSDKPIVYFNYEVHPRRWDRFHSRLATLGTGFEFAQALTSDEHDRVSVLVSKTRELDDAELSRFPGLRGILLWTTEDWPATFD